MQALLEERETLTSQLDEASERVLLLERIGREQSGQLRQTQREVRGGEREGEREREREREAEREREREGGRERGEISC